MGARPAAGDVISLSSSSDSESDSESDCRIVKVVPSPARLGKNRWTRWKTKPSGIKAEREAAMAARRSTEMMIHKREEGDNKDRLGTKSTSRAYGKWLNEDSMERRRDGVCGGGLQGTKQSILRDGHLSATGEDAQASHQQPVDPKLASASSPFWSQGAGFRQEVRHRGDDDWGARSRRSCSTATLDFSPKMDATRVEELRDSGRDEQDMFSMLNESSEAISFGDAPRCPALNPREAMSSSEDPTPSRETLLEEELGADGARLTRQRRSRHKSHANDDLFRSTGGSQHGRGPWPTAHRDRRQLPRRRRRRSGRLWDSIINVAAFDALPGPLFTRPKKVLREVTYEDAMRERTKRKKKQGLVVL